MRVYSFNDFKYICYIEGKGKAVEKNLLWTTWDKRIKVIL